MILYISFFFFFSSRRRHTSSLRDWSSDVCSSDLHRRSGSRPGAGIFFGPAHAARRSEERRVGKECRSRWWPDYLKKKKEEEGRTRQKEDKKIGTQTRRRVRADVECVLCVRHVHLS